MTEKVKQSILEVRKMLPSDYHKHIDLIEREFLKFDLVFETSIFGEVIKQRNPTKSIVG